MKKLLIFVSFIFSGLGLLVLTINLIDGYGPILNILIGLLILVVGYWISKGYI
jgi:hypothetical protein